MIPNALQIVKNHTVILETDIASAVTMVILAICVHRDVQYIVIKGFATKPMVAVHRDAQRDNMETRAIEVVVLGVKEEYVTKKI